MTDKELDKVAQAVFNKMRLESNEVKRWSGEKEGRTSVVEAVASSRDACKLKYLTGAAVVVYGIPFYL